MDSPREPERIRKGSETGRFLFGLIGIRSARDKREGRNKDIISRIID